MAETLAETLEEVTERCRLMDAALSERLQAFADELRALDPGFASIADRMVNRLCKRWRGQIGASSWRNHAGFPPARRPRPFAEFADFLREGPLVIAFHRGHWCPYCLMNASALTEIHGEARALGGQLIAITPETSRFNKELKAAANASFPVLTDFDNAFALEVGLTIWVGEEKKSAMKTAGWDISKYNANETWMLPIPATFIVGPDALVRARFVDPDYRKRMAVKDILAALRSP